MNVLDRLRSYPLLAVQPAGWLAAWVGQGIEEPVTVGQLVLQAGVTGRWACVLLEGEVRVSRPAGEREVSLGLLGPGELFGEYAVLPPHLNTATCRATRTGRILRLPLRPLRQTVAAMPAVQLHLKRWLRLHFLLNYVRERSCLGFASAPSFLPLADRFRIDTFPAGTTIQATGLNATRWFVLTAGEAVLDDGSSLTAGDSFGSAALVGDGWLPTVTAAGDVACVSLDREQLLPAGGMISRAELQTAFPSAHRVPHARRWVGQESADDCGLAALAMIARHFGGEVTLGEVRLATDHSPGMLSVLQLCQVADRLGLDAAAVRVTADRLADLSLPAVLHLTGEHFVVAFEASGDGVTIADPASGVVAMSRQRLADIWSGHAVTFSRRI